MNNFWSAYEQVLRTELAGREDIEQQVVIRMRNAKYLLNSNTMGNKMTDDIVNLLLMRFAKVACLCTSKLCQLELCTYTELIMKARECMITKDSALGWR